MIAGTAAAQQRTVVTSADYTRAMHQLRPWTAPLVDHAVRTAHWIDARRFWYEDTSHGVPTIMLADAVKGTKEPAFDTVALLASLNTAGLKERDATKLTVETVKPDPDNSTAIVSVGGERYKCAMARPYVCTKLPAPHAGQIADDPAHRGQAAAVLSPDGKRAVFIRDWNLWGPGREYGVGTAADDRWREGLRLRDG